MVYEPTFGGATGQSGEQVGQSGDGGDIGNEAGFLAGASAPTGGDRDSGGNEFDPDIHVGRDKFNADGSYRRKRGRRTGSGDTGSSGRRKAGKGSDNQASVEALTRALMLVHTGIASATKMPELQLENGEAEILARASARVMEEFDIRPDPKIEAVIGLVIAAGTVYTPKVYFIRQRMKAERDERRSRSH